MMSTETETTTTTVDAEETAPPAPVWPRIVTLQHPVKLGSELITSLEFRRGRMGDSKGIELRDKVPTNDLMLIASRLSGRPLAVIEKLDVDDVGEVTDIALDFYLKFLGGGGKRSR
ncbi:MAG: phage tail assembly protein [Kofleriaceae bacterium]